MTWAAGRWAKGGSVRVISTDVWEAPRGAVRCWSLTPREGASAEAVPLTINQVNHLTAARSGPPGQSPTWMAAVLDVPTPEDGVLADLTRWLAERHDSLRFAGAIDSSSVDSSSSDAGSGALVGRSWSIEDLELRYDDAPAGDPAEVLAGLAAPFAGPAWGVVEIDRGERSTVVVVADHQHVDARSVALLADEVGTYLTGEGGASPALAPAGSFLARARSATASVVPGGDLAAARQVWDDALERREGRLPRCPLELRLGAGEVAPQRTLVAELVDADVLAGLSAAARGAGVSTFAAVLTALTRALAAMGHDHLDVLVPVSTADPGPPVLGWLTTTAPLWLEAPASGDAAALRAAGDALVEVKVAAGEPLEEVFARWGSRLRPQGRDAFMVSWMTYPTTATDPDDARTPLHLSSTTPADDVQIWLARRHDGIGLRVRHPDTQAAGTSVAALITQWRTELRSLARDGAASY